MKKVGIWFLNNLKWILAIIVIVVTGGVVAKTMQNSYNSYKAYEAAYYENDLLVRSNAAAAPKTIEIDDEFVTYEGWNIASTKSRYANEKTIWSDGFKVTTSQEDYYVDDYIDLTQKGGSIALAFTLQERSFLDIDFVISSVKETTKDDETTYGVNDLLSNVDFIINGETMEDEIALANSSGDPEWHHLVMSGFALPAGDVTITVKSKSGKQSYMPQLRNVHLFSSQVLTEAVEAGE